MLSLLNVSIRRTKASTTDFRHPHLQWMTLDEPLTLDQSFVKRKNG